jgi:general L-amino acid transport system permease protein
MSAGANLAVFLGVLGTGLVVAGLIWWWRTRVSERTGEPHHRALWATGVFLVFAVAGYLILDRPFTISLPRLEGRRIAGGFSALGSFMAVMAALVLYTASHVAEIVRGSIQAVPKGQTEAAEALALRSFQRLRFVVLPQAFRIAVPPMINQFLNFVKNTSLALAVGYAEITRIVRQTIGNGQPAPQLILLLMLAYLAFSIVISVVANVVNRRLQLVER